MPYQTLFSKLTRRKLPGNSELLAAINRLIFETADVHADLRIALHGLLEMRGLPMKVAQIAAFTDPRLPLEVREVFATLPWQAKPIAESALKAIFIEDFGAPPQQLFREFAAAPVAAASIGQVHRARLQDGREVAVKVQSPGIEQEILENFSNSEFVQQFSRCAGIRNSFLVDDICKTVLRECDYLLEADNQESVREAFASVPEIIVPRVHKPLCSRRVITMDWIEGQSWSAFRSTASAEERSAAGRTISRFLAESAFRLHITHADLHPGNFLFLPGQVAFLDFGRILRLSEGAVRDFKRLHEFLLSGDREIALEFFAANSLIQLKEPQAFDKLWPMILEVSRHLRSEKPIVFSQENLRRHRAVLMDAAQLGAITISAEFFWTMLFTHTLIIAGRSDLEAAGDWREVIKGGGVQP